MEKDIKKAVEDINTLIKERFGKDYETIEQVVEDVRMAQALRVTQIELE